MMHEQIDEGRMSDTERGRMSQRVSLITLGYADLGRARSFYEALGWSPAAGTESDVDIFFYQALGMIIALWDRAKLAEDTAVSDNEGWGGITLAYCVGSRDEVDGILLRGEQAGGTIARPGGETFWGGYSGVLVDPGGHPWEIAHQPGWTLHEDGSVNL
jgi:predicted lactoylglutathione lyase